MTALSPLIVTEFCKLCNWAYECWRTHQELFEKNAREIELKASHAGPALERLSIVSHEYVLLQITKLHDRVVVAGQITLGIEYVQRYGGWDPLTQEKLDALSKELDSFAGNLRSVRNRLLSHNDLAAVVSGSPLGEFMPGEDEKYFVALQQFVDVVHDCVIGGPFPFSDLPISDVAGLLAQLK